MCPNIPQNSRLTAAFNSVAGPVGAGPAPNLSSDHQHDMRYPIALATYHSMRLVLIQKPLALRRAPALSDGIKAKVILSEPSFLEADSSNSTFLRRSSTCQFYSQMLRLHR